LIDIGAINEIGGVEARVPIVRWREKGMLREERTSTPAALVSKLGEKDALEIIRPSLEDIYIELVSAVSTGSTHETEAAA